MREYLEGRVRVVSLGREAVEGRFRARDARGEVAWPVVGESFDYMHVVEFAHEGARRAFHVHREHEEHIYVVSGVLRVLAGYPGAEPVALDLSGGDLVYLAAGVAHGLVAREPALAVSYGRGSNPLEDTERVSELDSLAAE